MANAEDYADVEILDDEEAARFPPPKPGALAGESTGSPHPGKVDSPQARHAMGIVAGVLALSGFAVVCVVGLAVGLPGNQVLLRAMGSMVLCWFVGLLIGRAMLVVIHEHLSAHREANPRPARPAELETPAERARKAA